jgi:GNAT superfamily N-acetyltransferase
MLPPDYEISTDPQRLSVDVIHDFIRTSYWGAGRTREMTERSIQNSLCFGLYAGGEQIGFARVVTDRAVIGYLCDVFVLPGHRRKGFGKALMNAVMDHPDLKDLPVFLLNTRDAHGLYERFGFGPLARPENVMRRSIKSTDARDLRAPTSEE